MTISTNRPLWRVKPDDELTPGDRREEVVTVVLADQSVLMHMALRTMLAANAGYAVAGAASTVFAAEQLVGRVRPGLAICDTDIAGESGLDLCQWIRRTCPATRVVILTSRDEPRLARFAIAAGARGYLLKDTAPAVITGCLDEVTAGEVVVDTRLGTSRAASLPAAVLFGGNFSRREGEVLAELTRGLDNKSIADQLCISQDTVKSHMKAIFRKLGARDRAHAVALALGAVPRPVPSAPQAAPRLAAPALAAPALTAPPNRR